MPPATQRPQGSMGPPLVPTGTPVRAGNFKHGMLSPQTAGRMSMPPPRLPLPGSNSSSTSSRPSLSMSERSTDSGPRARSHRPSFDDRVRTPLQDSFSGNVDVDAQFESLLETLEVPSTVRIKFATVTKDVKQSILESSMASNPAVLTSLGLPAPPTPDRKPKGKMSTPRLRKAKSSSSLGGTVHAPSPRPAAQDVFGTPQRPPPHARGYSVDLAAPPMIGAARSRPSTPSRPSSAFMPVSPSHRGERTGPTEDPGLYVHWLESHKGTDLNMDVGRMKKLRMLLRHETTGWVAAFLEAGGYARLLDRVQDLLDIEWREEQHDDKMLYELLRCVKALSTSEVGKAALRAAHPRPFDGLSTLLFSEKKPGDLACRQIIVELWLFLFELYPPGAPPTNGRRGSVQFAASPVDSTTFVRTLLLPESESKTKDYHDFVTAAHRPRPFKAWVQELSDICRDYFWVMCHGSNTLWQLSEVDEKQVERPVAPGGATGGVEFEAMGYVTTHFRLLNALAAHVAAANPDDARKLHHDLMVSGMDRILVTMRKASTTYYPTLHLELARYVDVLRRATGDKLPYLIGKLVGPPPEELRKHRSAGEWLPRLDVAGV